MTARWITADVFDGLATLEDGSVDLVVTSPPFLALRSYLPADHPDKGKEIGSEPTPAAFIDVMLAVTAELRRVLAPHGSICVELGDTYAGSGGAGGDYGDQGWRDGQNKFAGSARLAQSDEERHEAGGGPGNTRTGSGAPAILDGTGRRNRPADVAAGILAPTKRPGPGQRDNIPGWPPAKSKTLIPELYRIALAYGINPLTGQESPAGRWRVRNTVTWCRPNPPVGALGDKWRPATSDIVIACTSDKRYWDDIATRRPHQHDYRAESGRLNGDKRGDKPDGQWNTLGNWDPSTSAGAPLLDYWEIPPGGYPGSHYAVYPPALVEPLIKAMAPPKVCQTCGEPSRRITAPDASYAEIKSKKAAKPGGDGHNHSADWTGLSARSTMADGSSFTSARFETVGWTDCGHDNWRPAHVLDCFGGSGTTGVVGTGYGHDVTLIDLDDRNAELALERIGPFMFDGPHRISTSRHEKG